VVAAARIITTINIAIGPGNALFLDMQFFVG
jgi:hypothetical protein